MHRGPKVVSDLFTLYGHDYVIVTEYFSKYIEIERIANKSSSTVVNKIKTIFARQGIPKEVCTDNGPEYTAESFKHFAKEWDFKHTTSSPHFAQSNDLVERAIQTVKKSLKKAHDGNENPYLALLVLNTNTRRRWCVSSNVSHQPSTSHHFAFLQPCLKFISSSAEDFPRKSQMFIRSLF